MVVDVVTFSVTVSYVCLKSQYKAVSLALHSHLYKLPYADIHSYEPDVVHKENV